MIGSKVALAIHSGYHRALHCFSVCTRGKIQNFFYFCKTYEPHQDRQQHFKLWRYATGKTNPASPTPPFPSLLPPPASTDTHHPRPHNPLPLLSFPSLLSSGHTPHHHHHLPPTLAVHTLRPPRNVGPGCAFGVVAPFTHHRVWGNHDIHNTRIAQKTHITWRAAVRKDICKSDSKCPTPFC